MPASTASPPEKLTYSIREAAKLLGIHQVTAYRMARRGELPSMRLGSRVVVPADALKEFIEAGVQAKSKKARARRKR